MEKYVKYCPFCDKFYSRWDTLCAFCTRDLILYENWTRMKEREQYDWKAKTNPKRNISEIDKEHLKKIQLKATEFDAQYRAELEEKEHPKYVPTCPTCHSPDIEKISGTSKVVDAVVWGIWSKKAGKTFKCRNCGYEW